MFEKRLKEYREQRGLKRYQFAEILGISESFYSLIENGKKQPSKNFMIKLIAETEKPEEYWFYGTSDFEYTSIREEMKSTFKALDQLIDLGVIKSPDDFFKNIEKGTIDEVIATAIRADVEHIIQKKQK